MTPEGVSCFFFFLGGNPHSNLGKRMNCTSLEALPLLYKTHVHWVPYHTTPPMGCRAPVVGLLVSMCHHNFFCLGAKLQFKYKSVAFLGCIWSPCVTITFCLGAKFQFKYKSVASTSTSTSTSTSLSTSTSTTTTATTAP